MTYYPNSKFPRSFHYLRAPAFFLVVLILVVCFFVKGQSWQSPSDELPLESQLSDPVDELVTHETSQQALIYCDIKGAVNQQGVYALPLGSRLFDLIERAGGLRPDAAEDSLNLALLLEDQMLVKVLTQKEYQASQAEEPVDSAQMPLTNLPNATTSGSERKELQININTADQSQLETLPNIGPSKAQKIIAYRQEHGSFQTIEELQQVSGIGPKTFESLRDLITVGP